MNAFVVDIGKRLFMTRAMFTRLPHLRRWSTERAILAVMHQLLPLLDSGIPLYSVLAVLQSTPMNAHSRRYANALFEAVGEGRAMSSVWASQQPQLLRALMTTSEETGTVVQTLGKWVAVVHQRQQWRSHVLKVSAYPLFVAVSATSLMVFLWIFILPKFHEMYAQLGTQAPRATGAIPKFVQFLLGASVTFLLVVSALAVTCVVIRTRYKSLWDHWKHRLPGYSLVLMSRTRVLCLLLGAFLQSGVPLVGALQSIISLQSSPWLTSRCTVILHNVMSGQALPSAFGKWHPLLETSLRIAEQTGDLAFVLERCERILHVQLAEQVERRVKAAELLLLVITGVVVSAAMVMLFVPMYDAVAQISVGKG